MDEDDRVLNPQNGVQCRSFFLVKHHGDACGKFGTRWRRQFTRADTTGKDEHEGRPF
ncbi:hypothetical protein [Sphingomonas sp. CFBP 8760]|uniref:hypothetical protein n=1 Tax=Sphingomonas sp. CFBP 8760 TaxID=2775282 RepID=UPI001A921E49|nr:hypothetical protein [Sphingomonas sp. CFBP 8760]